MPAPTDTTPTVPAPENSGAGELSRQSARVSGTIFVSRVLGLLRDIVLVRVFAAATWILDGFYFAFAVPNLLRNLLGEGALSGAFIPQFIRAENKRGEVAGAVISYLFLFTGAISALGALACGAASYLAEVGGKTELTLVLLAIMFPFAALICVSAILGAVLQCLKSFVLPAAMSCLLNIFIIAAVVGAAARQISAHLAPPASWADWARALYAAQLAPETLAPLIKIAAGAVLLAGAAQIIAQYAAIRARGIVLKFALPRGDEFLGKIWTNFLPASVGLGVVQLNALLDNVIGYAMARGMFGFAAEGATTYLFLGNRLMQLPLGIFTIAAATTAFPTFAALAAKNEHADLSRALVASLRRLWFVMMPAAAGLIAVGDALIRLFYQGADLRFDDAAVYRAAAVLVILAVSLPFFSAIHLFTRAFYALGDYRTPMKIAIGTVALNLLGNLLLPFLPDYYRQTLGITFAGMSPTLGEAGLALSTTLCAMINAWRLWWALGKKVPEIRRESWKNCGAAPCFALYAAATAIGAYWILRSIPYGPEFIYRLERVVCAGVGGALIYSIFASTFSPADYARFMQVFSRRKKV